MSDSKKINYGKILQDVRIYHGYKQKDISNYLNITSQAYSNYERNHRTPDMEVMDKIARFYGITLDQLINGTYDKQLREPANYRTSPKYFQAKADSMTTISITGKQAKMLTDLLALTEEQQDVCHKLISFMKIPNR